VAYDFSDAANRALEDAMMLAHRFQAEILIAHAVPAAAGTQQARRRQLHSRDARTELAMLRWKMAEGELRCREIVHTGDVARVLVNVAEDEDADLLLMGAYGSGSEKRKELGSTAEKLLRALHCPIVMYGPAAVSPAFRDDSPGVLVPIEFLTNHGSLMLAMNASRLLNARVDILHVVDVRHSPTVPEAAMDAQYNCELVAAYMRREGLKVSQTLLFGKPDTQIVEQSRERRSSLILLPLGSREHLTSDHVASSVIRNAAVPVMTCRIDG